MLVAKRLCVVLRHLSCRSCIEWLVLPSVSSDHLTFMNSLLRMLGLVVFVLGAFVFHDNNARAASVTAAGGYTNDFAVQPAAADWATFSRAGGAGDTYDSDADVNANITA